MCRKLFFLVSLIIIASLAVNASAGVTNWTDANSANSYWTTPDNWDAGVPDDQDSAYNGGIGSTIQIASGMTAVCADARIGIEATTGSDQLNMTGGLF